MTRMQRHEDAARLAMGDLGAGGPARAPTRRLLGLTRIGTIVLAVAAAAVLATFLS